MTTKRAHIAALLLCALAPVGAAASTPTNAELQKAVAACTAVAANDPRGVISMDASDWPQGFKGCGAIEREMELREDTEGKRAWEAWTAKHVADQALIRKVAAQTRLIRNTRVAAHKADETRKAYMTALQEHAPYWKLSELYLVEREAYDAWAADTASALGSGTAVQETPRPSTINWRQFKRHCVTAAQRAAQATQ